MTVARVATMAQVRVFAIRRLANFTVCCLGGSSDPLVGVYFEASSLDLYTVARWAGAVWWCVCLGVVVPLVYG